MLLDENTKTSAEHVFVGYTGQANSASCAASLCTSSDKGRRIAVVQLKAQRGHRCCSRPRLRCSHCLIFCFDGSALGIACSDVVVVTVALIVATGYSAALLCSNGAVSFRQVARLNHAGLTRYSKDTKRPAGLHRDVHPRYCP